MTCRSLMHVDDGLNSYKQAEHNPDLPKIERSSSRPDLCVGRRRSFAQDYV